MNLKKRLKEILAPANRDGGFTLVELIVVIAILGVLSGVAVPAYGGYVAKANKQADMTLVSEIEHALVMAYYADPASYTGGAIVSLSATEEADAYGNPFAVAAMKAAFGDNWAQSAKLKYDGWKSENIDGSRFKNKETDLLDEVDHLTSNLMDPINAFAGDNFRKFMTDNGIDTSDKNTVSNAAVLYVANNTANLTPEKQQQVVDIFSGAMTSGGSMNVLSNLTDVYDGDMVSAAAVMYAVAEAYSTHTGSDFRVNFSANETPESAGAAINNAFMNLARVNQTGLKTYLESGLVEQDVKAYMDILTTVNSAKGQVIGNLGSLGTAGGPTWASGYSDLFADYNNGGTFVFLKLDKNGVPVAETTMREK